MSQVSVLMSLPPLARKLADRSDAKNAQGPVLRPAALLTPPTRLSLQPLGAVNNL
ncbi:MAG: hypothetical protein ACUVRZ_03650 [Desulfobacca sp.]|uniref:hypothetical protein n=1 Tax=Desulfobacca sp. TaxID=2067990 RepID=UPI00404AA4F4